MQTRLVLVDIAAESVTPRNPYCNSSSQVQSS